MAIKEDVYYEGGPHIGDLIFHCVLAITVVFIPITIGAIIRAIWVRYRITSRRISVTGGWMGRNRTDLIYSEVTRVAVVPRGLGLWGDMAVQLKDGSRLELRALPNFRELHDKIMEHISPKAQAASQVKI
ncbi:PH domain-containing protein [Leptothoe sp. PORK10 BA2]|uniref:PH domain-containing protein n=1 Tax=Leptothoe sp. PORK10 BA2 TaxID=3110254 RepID=UPI002B1EDC1E|nr:PH domain-containing protein [Leptothoe sp. PORK10 BA2]MEA5466417.1 PH domain-containing protein [Leptothoe sp. PORK10 BA2]